MRAISISAFGAPEKYELTEITTPGIKEPTDILIRVHSAGVNPVDVKKASGVFKLALKEEFPYCIGYDCAGVVTATGQDVQKFKAGHEVYVRLPESSRGSWAEYASVPERFVSEKPASISFSDAASLPLAGMTALQALRKYGGDLTGKTVLVPAGLSGTGACACQLAKTVFGAGKVITTVSTAKVAKVPQLLGEDVIDQTIDYTKTDLHSAILAGSVDFLFDTTGEAMKHLSLMKPQTGHIVSISTLPSGDQLQTSGVMRRTDNPQMPALLRLVFNSLDWVSKMRGKLWGVKYEYMFLEPNGNDLETLTSLVNKGKLKPVVGRIARLDDIQDVRAACQQVFDGKGGIGKTVIEVIND